jgi:peptidoglycan/xylan/chitin deacetylase (PgdA/CDA1 family)
MKPVAIKIDVDTHDGMRDGVPLLLSSLEKFGIRATFCLSYGPDNAGKAIFRAFREPAFLLKMFRTGAPSLYGLRTILSGTLLPARPVATAFPDTVRQIKALGHEVIVHAWNHRRWQDRLHRMNRFEIEAEYSHAFRAHEKIIGERPHAVASPGWQATGLSLAVEDSLNLLYASDMREGRPCFPKSDGRVFRTLQIPGTGPCIEELLTVGIKDETEIIRHLLKPLERAEQPVLTLHAEVEGGPYRHIMEKMMPQIISRHGKCITLREAAEKILRHPDRVPTLELCRRNLPGRAGTVASVR